MRIISKKALQNYWQKFADAKIALLAWHTKISPGHYKNLHELRKTFPAADAVGKYTIFDIGGNKYRLITAIHYNTQMVFIREFWTHAQYSKEQIKLQKGDL